MGNSNSLPTLNFELKGMLLDTGDGIDANPADAIKYISSDSLNGINIGDTIDSIGLDRVRTYAKAADILISLPPDSNQKADEIINDFCSALDTAVFLSEDKVKFVPLCMESITGNGATYTPNTTVLYDLTADDFLPMDDGLLVSFERVPDGKAYNQYTIEFLNRANSYESETVDEQVLVDVNKRGLRPADSLTMHFLHTKARASYVARTKALNSLTRRNKYTFHLDWTFSVLEPGDLLTITDAALGITKQPVIVDSWEEVNDEEIEIVAFGIPRGKYSAAVYDVHEAERPFIDFNVPPGNTNAPIIFEPPAEMTTTGLETWMAVSGENSWGGCSIWLSDANTTYKYVGKINNPARYGTVAAAITSADTSITVQLNDAREQLQSGTTEDAQNLRTICWVDGEAITYTTATLVAAGRYTLTGLVRGAYNTKITSHAAGSAFVRCDDALFKYPFDKSDIGNKVYIKLTSFNVYGGAEQSLADVNAHEHILNAVLPNNVTDIEFAEHFRDQGNGVVLIDLQVTFTPPDTTAYTHSEIYYKSNNPAADELLPISDDLASTAYDELANALQGWKYAGNGIKDITIPNLIKGDTYTVRVVAVTKNDLKPEFDTATTKSYTIEGKTYQPYAPTGLQIKITDVATVSWDKASQNDVDFTEIRTDKNTGTDTGKISKTTANKAIVTLPARSGTLYAYHHNTADKYSAAAYTTWNKPKPAAPTNVKVTPVVQGFVVSCDALPQYCSGINVHVNAGTATTIYFSPNNTYNFKSMGGIYDVQVAYLDLFDEGELSAAQDVTVKAYIDTALLAAEVQSLATNEKIILDGVAKANAAATQLSLDQVNTSLTDAKNRLSTVEGTVSTNSTAISNLTTGINLKADQMTLDALTGRMTTAEGTISTQAGQIALKANQTTVDTIAKTVSDNKASFDVTINGITQTVTSNKATQDGINSSLSTQINTQAGQITQITSNVQGAYTAIAQNTEAIQLRATKDDVNALINISSSGVITIKAELLDITAQSHFANGIIAEGMIQSKAVTADKMDIESLSAITATIGTLRTATTGARTEISDNLIQVYDANNVLRVRMGVWS
ncbi:MAG: phage tail protein [Phycisphaerales bacterium]